MMFIDNRHLSDTIKKATGMSPCDICNTKTIQKAKELLIEKEITIAEIARIFTFEPTNFTKYFKKHTGETPSDFRNKTLNYSSAV